MRAEIARRQSNTEKVLDLFRRNPRVWLKAEHFMDTAGMMAWRTRISDARKIVAREGGTIENRVTYLQRGDPDTEVAFIVSEYRYLPYVPLGRAADVPPPDQMRMEFR